MGGIQELQGAWGALCADVFCLFPAKKCPSCPSCSSPVLPSCLENGIGYREKCFYFVENETDWNRSQIFCRSLRGHLGFLLRYGSSLHYWIGLHREGSGPWKWSNGSLFSNWYVSSFSGEHKKITNKFDEGI
uniref:C-type lectin domain-containing protein n=1 Tax=Accipiter nisus TaxID=211598 RepID=A0A8B9MSH9_9AVES